MPKFGAFQTVSEISRGALATVWSARREDEDATAAPKYVVKACKPDVDIAGAEQAALAVKLFLEQAELQQRIAKEASDTWAPIIALARMTAEEGWGGSGSGGEGGAYYVTDLYAWSLERLASRRIDLTTPNLVRYVRGIMRGLAGLKKMADRPHGNLKAGNVLLSGDGEPEGLSVRLSDPLPGSQLEKGAGETVDLRALGEILHLLITLQAYRGQVGWPIPDSPRWARLAGGAKWLTLCNRLLDPYETQSKATTQDVETALAGIESARTPGGKKKKIIIGLAAVLLLAVGGVTAYVLTHQGGQNNGGNGSSSGEGNTTVQFDPKAWEALCDAYLNEKIDLFGSELASPVAIAGGKSRVGWYGEVVPSLAPEFAGAGQKIKDFDPRILADKPSAERFKFLRENPPDVMKETKAADIKAGLQYIDDLKQKIQDNVATPLRKTGKEWDGKGWTAAAGHLKKVADDLVAKPFSIEALDRSVETQVLVSEIAKLESAVAAIAKDVEAKAEGDVVLLKFGGWPRTYAGEESKASAGLNSLRGIKVALEDAKATGESLLEFVKGSKWSEICRKELVASNKYTQLAAAGTTTRETFNGWIRLVEEPEFAPPTNDPRWQNDAITKTNVEALVQTLKAAFGKDDPKDQEFAEVFVSLGKARELLGLPAARGAHVEVLNEVEGRVREWWSQPYGCDTKKEVQERFTSGKYAEVATALSKAVNDYKGAVIAIKTKRGELKEIAALEVDALWGESDGKLTTREIVDAWHKWRGAKPSDRESPEAAARASEVRPIHEFLVELHKQVQTVAWAWPPKLDDALRQSLEADAARKKTALLSAFLQEREAAKNWSPEVKDLTAKMAASAKEYGEHATRIVNLTSLLDQGYGSAEPTGAPETVQKLWDEVPVSVQASLTGLKKRVDGLKELEESVDLKKLSDAVGSPQSGPEAVLAAWQGLSRANPTWPATPDELVTERRMIAGMKDRVERLTKSRTDGATLNSKIETERKRRWIRYVAAAKTRADVAAALTDEMLAKGTGFGVEEGDLKPKENAQDALVLFRWKLYKFEDAVSKYGAGDDEKVKAASEAFVIAARGIVDGLADKADAQKMLVAIKGHVNRPADTTPAPKFEELGPGSMLNAGWKLGPVGDGSVLSFTSKDDVVKLDFILVQPQGGEPFYLARTELSIEQFKAIANALPQESGWAPLKKLMNPAPGTNASVTDKRGDKPRAWIPDVREMIIPSAESNKDGSTDWLKWKPDFRTVHPYVTGFRLVDDANAPDKRIKKDMEPTPQTPMQFISPSAALAIARLAGCRLPTSLEWTEAAAPARQSAAPVNLRDTAWKNQFDYNPDAASESVYGPPGDKPAVAPNDGWIWFMPVSKGGEVPTQFVHMKGNVAEMVLDTTSPDGSSSPALQTTLAKDATAFIKANKAGLSVIGGSALGPPDRLDKFLITEEDLRGWPDVGVRLAFSAKGARKPPDSLAILVKQALDNFWAAGGK